jgi:molybdopterin-biosynthesis enzyme MoeA-like protein
LKAIVEGPLQNVLSDVFAAGAYRERRISVQCGDESELAPALSRVASNHPEVYLKSRASHFGQDVRFQIMICASGADAEQAEQRIESAASELKRGLQGIGVRQDE